jgi:hypothetical protein
MKKNSCHGSSSELGTQNIKNLGSFFSQIRFLEIVSWIDERKLDAALS